jgi:hypothetical protein
MREDGWITKTEAAALLGVDERTIERRARAGRISARARLGFPTLYLAADVEKLRQTGNGEVRTGLLEHGSDGNGNGHGGAIPATQNLDKFNPAADDPIRQLAAAFRAFLLAPTGPTGPTAAPTGPTAAYVDKAEALAIAGISYGALRAAVQAGEVKQRGRRYRRPDLEAL